MLFHRNGRGQQLHGFPWITVQSPRLIDFPRTKKQTGSATDKGGWIFQFSHQHKAHIHLILWLTFLETLKKWKYQMNKFGFCCCCVKKSFLLWNKKFLKCFNFTFFSFPSLTYNSREKTLQAIYFFSCVEEIIWLCPGILKAEKN